MSAGLQVFNTTGNVQIDQNYRNQRLAAIHTALPAARFGEFLDIPEVNIAEECPLIFARTAGWVGGAWLSNHNASGPTSGTLIYSSSQALDIAVFTAKFNTTGQSPGLEVYDASGRLVYASSVRYPRIVDIVGLNGSQVSGVAGFTNLGVIPWVCLNPLVPSLSAPLGSGSDLSYPPWIVAAQVTSSTISYKMVDAGDILGGQPPNAKLSPYNGRTLHIPVALIPGT